MMKHFEALKNFLEQSPKTTAKIVGKDLIVSMPDALKPSVWKTNLEEIRSALFEVEQEGDKYVLVMKADKTKTEVINSYTTREEAVKALHIVSRALLRSSSKDDDEREEKPLGFFKSFIIFLAFFFITLFIISLFSGGASIENNQPEKVIDKGQDSSQIRQQESTGKNGSARNIIEGVPLSADDILGGGR